MTARRYYIDKLINKQIDCLYANSCNMNRFEYTAVKAKDSYSQTATKQAYTLTDQYSKANNEIFGSLKTANPFISQTAQQDRFEARTRTVKEKKVSYVPIGDLDSVKRKLVFDDIPVTLEANNPDTTTASSRRKNSSAAASANCNGIRKFR